MEPEDPPPPESQLGPFALLWVAAVLGLNWLIYAVPTVLALSAGFDLPLMTGTTLTVASVEPDRGTVIVSGTLAVIAVVLVLVHAVARWTLPKESAPRSLLGKLMGVAALGAVALPAEWCAGGVVPDLLSVAPILILSAVIGVIVPIALLVASIKATAWLLGASLRSPFFGGIVAALGTLLLTPPAAAAASLFLLVEAVEAASELPPPEPVPIGAVGLLGAMDASSAQNEIDECFQELERMRAQIEWMIQSTYRFSVQEAEDVASEAMISVCVSESLSTYQNLEAVYTKAAKNRAIDVRRKRRGEVGVEPALCLPWFGDDWRLASEVMLADQALARLDSRTQEALRMWSHDEPHAVIAQRLGIDARKSRDLVGNGLKSMRAYVRKNCLYPEAK